MRAVVRTRIARALLISFSSLVFVVVATIVVMSIIQTQDTTFANEVYNGELCKDSILSDYRPFRLFVAPKEDALNQTTYKLCMKMKIGSTHANGTVLCVFPPAPKTNNGKDYDYFGMQITCAWDGLTNTARRLGITISCLFVPIFLIIWLVKESHIAGKICGILYMLFAFAAAVGFSWLMITDADSVRKSMDFCKATYIDGTMCNPLEYPQSVREDCTCNEMQYITVVLLETAGIILWLLVFASSIFRCCAYRYSDDEIIMTATEEEQAPIGEDSIRERHVSQIASSYGYNASNDREALLK